MFTASHDILSDDHMELWEHGTFMVLALLTYDLWHRSDQFVESREAERAG